MKKTISEIISPFTMLNGPTQKIQKVNVSEINGTISLPRLIIASIGIKFEYSGTSTNVLNRIPTTAIVIVPVNIPIKALFLDFLCL